jgi:hypothetical protein
MLVVMRAWLGLLFAISFSILRRSFTAHFIAAADSQRRLRNFIALAAVSQFHLLFYSSRPLANTLASVRECGNGVLASERHCSGSGGTSHCR